MRLRLRREISKDVERARRDVISELLEVRRQPRTRTRGGPHIAHPARCCSRESTWCEGSSSASSKSLGVKPIDSVDARFDPALHEADQHRSGRDA